MGGGPEEIVGPSFLEESPNSQAASAFGAKIDTPVAKALWSYWSAKWIDGKMPARAELYPEEMIRFLAHVYLIEVQDSPRQYFVRLAGTTVNEALGLDTTNRYVHEYLSEGRAEMWQGWLDQVANEGRGIFLKLDMSGVGKKFIQGVCLILPLMSDDKVDMVIGILERGPSQSA